MNNKLNKTVLSGLVGTAIMSLVMMIAPMMGMPKMSPPAMLAGMMGMPVMAGWVMHFMIGIIFAFIYSYLYASKISIANTYIKGALFGFLAFIFAQTMMAIMGSMFTMQKMEGPMLLIIMGSIIGHIVFGITVSKIAGQPANK